MKRFAYFAGLFFCGASYAGTNFPNQPTTGQTDKIQYANEVASVATYPAPGHVKYRFSHVGVVSCAKRTYVLEVKQMRSAYGDNAHTADIMHEGQCDLSKADDKDFTVERFESYSASIGHADLAYATVSFSAQEAGGSPMTFKFYVSRSDIVPTQ